MRRYDDAASVSPPSVGDYMPDCVKKKTSIFNSPSLSIYDTNLKFSYINSSGLRESSCRRTQDTTPHPPPDVMDFLLRGTSCAGFYFEETG